MMANQHDEIVPAAQADTLEMAPIAPPPASVTTGTGTATGAATPLSALAPITSKKSSDRDPLLVQFDDPCDPDNPLDWRSGKKWAMTDVLSATGFCRIMVSTIIAPALTTIASELDMSATESAMALSIYLLATAFGPLFIGPLSEIYGREVILHASSVWFLVWNFACGWARTKEFLIAARFLAGFGASAIYALAGGVMSDIWRPEQRGQSLGIYLLIPLLAVAVGPIIGGFMAARVTWRWMFWSTSAFQAVMTVMSIFTFKETFGPVILQRRAARLRKETGNAGYRVETKDTGRSAAAVLTSAFTRPLRLLTFHPVLQITSVLSAFDYGILYIVLSTFSQLWTDQYGQSVEISGLHYLACSMGELIGSQVGARSLDYFWRRRKERAEKQQQHAANVEGGGGGSTRDNNDRITAKANEPENRLPLSIPGFLIMPAGLIWYGWAAEKNVHWAVVDVAVVFMLFGMQTASMAQSAYVIDVYSEHASSAMAAEQFVRSLTAFLFPLFAPALYSKLGYGWGNTTIALVGVVVLMPPLLWLWKNGARLRARAISTY